MIPSSVRANLVEESGWVEFVSLRGGVRRIHAVIIKELAEDIAYGRKKA